MVWEFHESERLYLIQEEDAVEVEMDFDLADDPLSIHLLASFLLSSCEHSVFLWNQPSHQARVQVGNLSRTSAYAELYLLFKQLRIGH